MVAAEYELTQQKLKGKMIIHLIREEPYRTVSDLIQQDHHLFGDIKLSQDDDLTASSFMMCLIYTDKSKNNMHFYSVSATKDGNLSFPTKKEL